MLFSNHVRVVVLNPLGCYVVKLSQNSLFMNRGLLYCMREYDSIFHFKKSFFIYFEEVEEFGHRELTRAFSPDC